MRDAANQVKYENEDTSLVEARLEDADESEVCRSTEHRWQISGESDNVMFEKNNEESGQELHISSVKDCEMRIVEMTTSAAEDDGSVKDELQYSTHQTSVSASSCRLPTSSNAGSNQSHSTLGDPNFVENYFKVLN